MSSSKSSDAPTKTAEVPAKQAEPQVQPENVKRVAWPVRVPDENTKRVKTTRDPEGVRTLVRRIPPKR
jgi:hypothetical protein